MMQYVGSVAKSLQNKPTCTANVTCIRRAELTV